MQIEVSQIPHIYRNRFLRDNSGSLNISKSSTTNNNAASFHPVNLWGQYFDDTEDIKGDLYDVGSIFADGSINAPYVNVSDTLNASTLIADSADISTLQSKDITTEYLKVTKQAHFFSLIIDELKAVGGQVILSPARAKIDLVEQLSDGSFKCYFMAKDSDGTQIHNNFIAGDQAICQTFNVATGTSYDVSNKYYWRLVTSCSSGNTVT